MDVGPFLRNRSVQLGWLLLPPLIMLTLFILMEVDFQSVQRRLDVARSFHQAIPRLERELQASRSLREHFAPVAERADAERLNASLHALAAECGAKLNVLGVVFAETEKPAHCTIEIKAEGTLAALGTFIHRAQRTGSLHALHYARLVSAGAAETPLYTAEIGMNFYGIAQP